MHDMINVSIPPAATRYCSASIACFRNITVSSLEVLVNV